jgi:hypothetical protein
MESHTRKEKFGRCEGGQERVSSMEHRRMLEHILQLLGSGDPENTAITRTNSLSMPLQERNGETQMRIHVAFKTVIGSLLRLPHHEGSR